jgi:hypothetical protein
VVFHQKATARLKPSRPLSANTAADVEAAKFSHVDAAILAASYDSLSLPTDPAAANQPPNSQRSAD